MKRFIGVLAAALFFVTAVAPAFADPVGSPFFTAVWRCDRNLYATDLQVCNDFLIPGGSQCIDFSDEYGIPFGDVLDLSNKSNKIPCASVISTVVVGLKILCEDRPTKKALKLFPPAMVANAEGTQGNVTGHCVILKEVAPLEPVIEEENGIY